MSYQQAVQRAVGNPEELELAYRQAVKAGSEDAFAEAVEAGYEQSPDNRLLAAWHYRLTYAVAKAKRRVIAWGWALPVGLLNGLLLWLLSDDKRFSIETSNPLTGQGYALSIPVIALLALPVSVALISLFLTLAGKRRWGRLVAVALGLAAAAAYALWLVPHIWPRLFQEQYLSLMVLHLGLQAWAGAGFVVLARRKDQKNRFAFLAKSLEAFVAAGLLAICGGLFTAITFGLFNALGIELPELVTRLFLAGGGGLIAVVAVALVYDPAVQPAEQSFDEGPSKLVALLLRLLLPLSVVMLLVYLAFIPFNWREPFQNRDVLLAFNGMLFAAVALMVGVTPLREDELGEKSQTWLRRGAMALAALALVIGLYALAAIVFRTVNDRITPNRLLFIGWNIVNIAILITLLIQQVRAGRERWLPAMHSTFAVAMVLYLAWSVAGLLALPWVFRGVPPDVAGLPPSIQQYVYERADPILLKCLSSPHIYLLEHGQKRWIKDIPTMTVWGYRWSDVQFVSHCDDLRGLPDGETIPPGSGPPPQP